MYSVPSVRILAVELLDILSWKLAYTCLFGLTGRECGPIHGHVEAKGNSQSCLTVCLHSIGETGAWIAARCVNVGAFSLLILLMIMGSGSQHRRKLRRMEFVRAFSRSSLLWRFLENQYFAWRRATFVFEHVSTPSAQVLTKRLIVIDLNIMHVLLAWQDI